MSTADELAKLAALRDQGILTDAEFEAEKAKLIGEQSQPVEPGPPASTSPPPPPPPPPPPAPTPGPPAGPTGPPVDALTGPLAGAPAAVDVSEEDERRRRAGGFFLTQRQMLIGLLVLALIGAGIGLGVALGGSGTPASASEVFLQPKNSTGANPFTPNVGTDATVARSVSNALPTPSGGTASYPGNSIGLYGGTLSTASCNPVQMINYLGANPSLARAWAAAEGISVSDIPAYISSLTPMTLRYDTRVTNHGYINGVANPIPEILEAGQAVLVDHYGVPRARCYCGNPLTPPVPVASPTYVGTPWPGYSPTTVIVVQQSPVIINNFTVIDNTTGDPFNRPAGSTGTSDGPPLPSNAPTMPGVNAPGSTSTTPTTAPQSTTAPPATTPVTAPNGQPLGTGAVQVTLTWSTYADLDLHVLEPDGTEIYYGNRTSGDGGTLDVDSNGGCNNETNSPVENVYWTNSPPNGTYTARVNYFDECGGSGPGTGTQDYTITVKINGQVVMQRQGSITGTGTNQDYPFTVG